MLHMSNFTCMVCIYSVQLEPSNIQLEVFSAGKLEWKKYAALPPILDFSSTHTQTLISGGLISSSLYGKPGEYHPHAVGTNILKLLVQILRSSK